MPTVTAAARPVLFAATGAVAFILVRLVPAARVYDLCVGTARLLARPLNWLARCLALGVLKDIGVTILQHMLCVATRHGGVAVRVRVDDDGLLEAVFRRHGRVLLCTAHLGLTMAIQRALHERAIPLYLMGRPVRADGLHWGCPKAAPIIPSDALCLIRARRVLAQGHALLVYPDMVKSRAGRRVLHIRRNLFTFAARTRTPVLFFAAELAPDGAIVLHVTRPDLGEPDSAGDGTLLAETFCAFLRARTGWPYRPEPL